MTHLRKRPSSKDANYRIPESITTEFIERIMNLRSSPKSDYLKECFLSKFLSSETEPPETRRQRAIFKWLLTERNNEATNDRLLLTHEEYNILPRVGFRRYVEWTRALIEDTIGAVPRWDSLIGTFSGGASTSRARTSSHPAGKYLGQADATGPAAEIFAQLLSEDMPLWESFKDDMLINIVPGNVLFTATKRGCVN